MLSLRGVREGGIWLEIEDDNGNVQEAFLGSAYQAMRISNLVTSREI